LHLHEKKRTYGTGNTNRSENAAVAAAAAAFALTAIVATSGVGNHWSLGNMEPNV